MQTSVGIAHIQGNGNTGASEGQAGDERNNHDIETVPVTKKWCR